MGRDKGKTPSKTKLKESDQKTNKHTQTCGFCIKTWPVKEINHKGKDCPRLKVTNKHRGEFPEVVVEKGPITWEDREPTSDSEEVNRETLSRTEDKLEELANNQVKLLEEIAKLKEASQRQARHVSD